ncbi:MAG TPA: vWA domain-containing protein, partial [Pirellulaceae bacterium]|nr:vWA domain-containing protein [Pirellulaceae bacterium]
GEAYALPARRAYTQLRKQLEKLSQDKERLQRLGSDVAWRTALVGEPLFPTSAERLHSLPLLRTFTSGDAAAVNDLTARLRDLAKNPSEENITQLLASAKSGPTTNTAEVRSLQLFQQYVPQNAAGALPDVLSDQLLAEQIAVPQDVRALAWLKPLLDAADQQRRNAEDELFSGDSAAARIAAADAAKEYEAIRAATDRVSQAFATCDQACAELPAWCLWVGRSRPAMQSLAHGEEVIKALTELVRETELLATQLAEPAGHADNAQRIAAIAQIADRVQKGLQLLSAAARTEQQQLLTEQNEKRWPASLYEIEALLALPLLKAEQRQELIDRHVQLATALAGQPIKLAARKPASEESSADSSLHVGTHPLLLIATALASGKEDEPANNASLSALRDAWQRISRQSATDGKFPAAHEYQARLASAVGVPLEQDIVSSLRRADWQSAWIWYAKRGLDDFLGPLTAKDQPLFAITAEDYLQLARASHPEITAGVRASLDDVARLLSERRTAAKEGVLIDAHNSLVLFSDQGARTAIEIAPHDDSPLPAGRLALTVQTSAGRPIEATIQFAESGQQTFGIETPLPAKPVRLEMLGQSLGGSPALLRVVAHQRGNAFSAPLVIRAAMGPTVHVEPTLVKQSSVVVNGAQRKKPAVIVVLDCSKSMEAPVPVEATDGRTITKLEAAKNALQTMLNQLAREGDAVVGVKLVGHRLGWTTREPLRISKQSKYGRAIPESVSPHNDVESALTVGRFDALAAGEVSSLLKTVVPWGQSPLYLGVIESLNELANLDEDVDANIIVITDGLNYQFLPSTTEVVPPDSTQSVDDVIRAADGKAIRVHVVGFAVDQGEAAAAEEQFTRIAKATNGTYQPLNDASRIIPHLESLLGPSTWQLTAQAAAGDQAHVAELGQSQAINVVPGEENRFEAVFRSAGEALTLRGGEAVALRVAASGQRLDALPYPGNSPVLARLVSGESKVDTGYLVAVDRPVRTRESGLQLAVSLRQKDDHFVARPAELWIEATPRSLQGTAIGPTHVYYDTVFVNGETSPLVRWNPGQWPSKAEAVEVRCWFQPLAVEAAVRQSVTELATKRTPVTDPAISEHSWLVEADAPRAGQPTFEVRVATWDRGAESGFPNLKVNVRAKQAGVVPRSIERVFDAENRVTAHRFAFATADVSPEDLLLELTTRQQITTDAWRTGEAVIVNIDSGAGLITPAAP